MKYPNVIYWEKPGYYYFNNGWKYSSDQNSTNESEDRKYFTSKKEAEDFGLLVVQESRFHGRYNKNHDLEGL